MAITKTELRMLTVAQELAILKDCANRINRAFNGMTCYTQGLCIQHDPETLAMDIVIDRVTNDLATLIQYTGDLLDEARARNENAVIFRHKQKEAHAEETNRKKYQKAVEETNGIAGFD